MLDSKGSKQFFNRGDRDNLVEEVPSQLLQTNYEGLPSGYEWMGGVRFRDREARGFASGRMPWWTLIAGWLFFGSITLIIIFVGINIIINGMYLEAIFPWVIGWMLFSILWRGTAAKLRKNKHRSDRR